MELKGLPMMLDSGAYHALKLGMKIDVREYADFASRHGRLFDVVVAPDVVGSCLHTISRTREFMKFYAGSFMPVLQGSTPMDFEACLEDQMALGVASDYWGVGNPEAWRGHATRLKNLLQRVCRHGVRVHLFGVGPRVYGKVARFYWRCVASVDTGNWSWEITWRRRTELSPTKDPVELEYKAMRLHLERFRRILEGVAKNSSLEGWRSGAQQILP